LVNAFLIDFYIYRPFFKVEVVAVWANILGLCLAATGIIMVSPLLQVKSIIFSERKHVPVMKPGSLYLKAELYYTRLFLTDFHRGL
jgi:hypothetical protein